MPHLQRTHFLTKNDVYHQIQKELMAGGIPEDDIINLSSLFLSIPGKRCDYTKCKFVFVSMQQTCVTPQYPLSNILLSSHLSTIVV